MLRRNNMRKLEVIIALEQQKIPEDKQKIFICSRGCFPQLMKLKEAQVYFVQFNASKEQHDVYNRAYLYYNYALFLAGESDRLICNSKDYRCFRHF